MRFNTRNGLSTLGRSVFFACQAALRSGLIVFSPKRNCMRLLLWLASAGLLTLTACQQEAERLDPATPKPQACAGGTCSYAYLTDARLRLQEETASVALERGNRLVFTYTFTADDNPQVADDEYSESLWFELDPDGAERVVLRDKELRDAKLTFRPMCFCIIELVPVEAGSLVAERLDEDRWQVELDLRFTWADEAQRRQVSGVFVRE